MTSLLKTCTSCKEKKPITEFRNRGGELKHLLKSWCKQCHFVAHKKWVERNKETVREYRAKDKWTLKKRCDRHGITVEEFWVLYEEQDGTCPICDKAVEAENSAIDHNHETGLVRGILCKKCNRGLGLLGDSPSTMARAEKYLMLNGYYGTEE